MRWGEFEAAAPELASFLRERLTATGILLLGTLRADGWPRISPCEAYLVDGEMLLGMMPGSNLDKERAQYSPTNGIGTAGFPPFFGQSELKETRRSQKPLSARTWGFDSPSRHQLFVFESIGFLFGAPYR